MTNQEGLNVVRRTEQSGNAPGFADWARNYQIETVNDWRKKLEETGTSFSRFEATGSLQTGHYRAPKPRSNTFNPSCPEQYDRLIEADVKLFLPVGAAVDDIRLIQTVEGITGAKFERTIRIPVPDKTLVISFLYKYEDLGGGLGFEWELDIINEPYFNHAPYYRALVSPEELAWEGDLRQSARDLGANFDDVAPMKAAQYNRAQYRAVLGYALAAYLAETSSENLPRSPLHEITPPLQGEPPDSLHQFIEKIRLGEAGFVMPTQEDLLPESIRRLLADGGRDELLTIPSEPAWVKKLREHAPLLIRPTKP